MKDSLPLATEQECKVRRETLINVGIITPGTLDKKFNETFEAAPKSIRVISEDSVPDEGVYKKHRVRSEDEYKRRLQNYFHILQSMLRDRKKLNIVFEK